jgi:hypothetical protein
VSRAMRLRPSIAILLLVAMPASTYAQTVQAAAWPVAIRAEDVRRAVAALAQRAPQPACDEAQAKGRLDAASAHHTTGWFFSGLGMGLVLGFIGTGAITGIAALKHPQPKQIPAGLQQDCYRDGYTSKAKSKNTLTALVGGLVGGAVWTVFYIGTREGNFLYQRQPLGATAGR